jgi:hypothetical protein
VAIEGLTGCQKHILMQKEHIPDGSRTYPEIRTPHEQWWPNRLVKRDLKELVEMMGAAGNFPVGDAKPSEFIGETTFGQQLRGVSKGSSTQRNVRTDREDWDDWTGGSNREA